MKILITGATGFVGAAITKYFFNSEHELILMVRDPNLLPLEIQEHERCTVLIRDLNKEIAPIDCDVLIHTAASTTSKVLAHFVYKTNVDGSKKLVKAVPDSCRIINISCASVYNLSDEEHKEDEAIYNKTLSSLSRSKYLQEKEIEKYISNQTFVHLRCATIMGIGDYDFLPKIRRFYNNGIFKYYGKKDTKASWLSINRLVHVVDHFCSSPLPNSAINISEEEPILLKEAIDKLLSNLLERPIKFVYPSLLLSRIIAGIRTILLPGNHLTQHSIDFFNQDHILNIERLKKCSIDLPTSNYDTFLTEYVDWAKRVGLTKILSKDKQIPWL